jgi:hypothetical protein
VVFFDKTGPLVRSATYHLHIPNVLKT